MCQVSGGLFLNNYIQYDDEIMSHWKILFLSYNQEVVQSESKFIVVQSESQFMFAEKKNKPPH